MKLRRITNNIVVDPDTQCWNWIKSCSSSGYGQLTENGKYWNTHVYSWVLHNGPLPAGHLVRHSCHNKKCCNPAHLQSGTHQDNWKDSEKIHTEVSTKRRAMWSVYGKDYQTCREAVDQTGISMASIIKFTKQGVFDEKAYEAGCRKGRRR